MDKKNLVITGASGQLGMTLQSLWPGSQLQDRYDVLLFDRDSLDITSASDVDAKLSQVQAHVIINAAAYTQVDQAESDRDNAFAVNELGVVNLARWAAANKASMLQVSTDFVFDGAATTPYLPTHPAGAVGDDSSARISAYGASKLAGERAMQSLLPEAGIILRTSWLYSEHGSNFVKTMLRLMDERDQLSIVGDQIGSPTSTHSLAQLIFAVIRQQNGHGVYHWSDGGAISWFEFAREIQRQGIEQGLLQREIPLQAIATEDYPTAAKRPAYSVLDRSSTLSDFDCPALSWQQQLTVVLKGMQSKGSE